MTEFSHFHEKIITEEGKKHLIAHKYAGADPSLTYKYILSPISQFIVDHLAPNWLAPNLITLSGFMIAIIPLVVLLDINFYSFDYWIPGYLFTLHGLCMLIYIIADNVDGKQARATGSASPLGMLFDHGCDSVVTGIIIITWLKLLGGGLSFGALCILLGGMNGFFMATLESYYKGGLFLPFFNVPSDGNFILSLIGLVGIFAGSNEWFDWDVPFLTKMSGLDWLSWREFWSFFAPFVAIAGIILNLIALKGQTTALELFKKMFTAVYINFTYITMFFYRGENPAYLEHNYIFFLFSYTLLFARLSKALMVNHCAKENYSMIQWPVFVFLSIMNAYTYVVNYKPELCTEARVNCFWLVMFGGFCLYYGLYVSSLLKHLSNALNIQIFKIKCPPQEVPLHKKWF